MAKQYHIALYVQIDDKGEVTAVELDPEAVAGSYGGDNIWNTQTEEWEQSGEEAWDVVDSIAHRVIDHGRRAILPELYPTTRGE